MIAVEIRLEFPAWKLDWNFRQWKFPETSNLAKRPFPGLQNNFQAAMARDWPGTMVPPAVYDLVEALSRVANNYAPG